MTKESRIKSDDERETIQAIENKKVFLSLSICFFALTGSISDDTGFICICIVLLSKRLYELTQCARESCKERE